MQKPQSNNSQIDIAIIGGGAAGLSAGIAAAKLSKIKNYSTRIEIFEAQNKIGKSILKTGNGRCNFSNYFIDETKGSLYNNPKFCNIIMDNSLKISNTYKLFGDNKEISAAMQMFDNLGLSCYYDENGKLFPYTNKASSVVDVLRFELDDLKVKISCNKKLKDVVWNKDNKNYSLIFESGKQITCKKIIFTIGSEKLSNKILKNDFVPYKKVLGPIKTDTKFIKNLDGVKAHVKASLLDHQNKEITNEIGEILFRKYGVSGICVFNLSRFLNGKKQTIQIDFAPEDSYEDLFNLVKSRFYKLGKNTKNKISAERLFAGMILPEIINNICNYAKVDKLNIKKENLKNICNTIKCFKLGVLSIGDEKQCQVSRGGIKTSALDFKTLALNNEPNIYFAGEVVDVDGPCGGYNLHWAWTSGILAGASSIIS